MHRPGGLLTNERFSGADDTPPKADCCIPAPPVLEFDQTGTLVHSWGGPGPVYDWPQTEHGVFVDHKDVVWLAGSGAKDAQLLKFTREGKFLAAVRQARHERGQRRPENMGMPANLTVDPATNEVYVADGYGNRRVIVLDGDTFAFKRMWGAYGNRPDDTDLGPYNPDAPPAQQFRLPHNISISRDGFVYVADRPNNRIQVFRKDGTYVKEAFISKRTFLNGAASGFALSADPQQRFLYMIDGANHHVWILNRETLQVLARFGQQGLLGGSLNVPHAITVDSRGNIYVGENFDARGSSGSSTRASARRSRGRTRRPRSSAEEPPNGHVAPDVVAGGHRCVHADAGHHHRQHRAALDGRRAWANRRCACSRWSPRMRWRWRMLIPASGWLADRFGHGACSWRRWCCSRGLARLCVVAQGSPARRVGAPQGIGGAMLLPVGRLVVMRVVPRSGVPRRNELRHAARSDWAADRPTLGGWLVQIASWHWIFPINLPLGAAGGIAALRIMPDLRQAVGCFDALGYALFAYAMVAVSLALDALSTAAAASRGGRPS